jgi:hypothetical protein
MPLFQAQLLIVGSFQQIYKQQGLNMGKITVTLSDETEKNLRAFISQKTAKQSLDEVVESSVKDYLEKQSNIGSTFKTFY